MSESNKEELVLSTLYGVEKNGKTKQWSATIYSRPDGTAYASMEFGQLDGQKQTTVSEYTVGKNIGKKNETTPLQQCVAETIKKWKDKRDKQNYSETMPSEGVSQNSEKVRPMLANKYDPKKPKKSDIVFPCFVQPKLDGLRCIMYMRDGEVVCQSRTGGTFETMGHIAKTLEGVFKRMPNLILDGELYTTTFPFEELAGLIKKKKITLADKDRLHNVQYHVYDIVCDKPYHQRLHLITDIFKKWDFKNIVLPVETSECSDQPQFRHYFAEYVERGYEGIMLRNRNGLYRENYRSNDLQKYKEFQEDEYPIIGFKEAEGRDKGTVIWICKTPEGREFSVRPRGTQEMRRKWFVKGESYMGKLLTVIYQELSELNVPRFPVGKDIRDGY